MRATLMVGMLGFCCCQSGVTLDGDGGLKFPCTPGTSNTGSALVCPGRLFCGTDGLCHSPDEGGSYACLTDLDCGGGFRCGPKRLCLDASADALRTDAPNVVLSPVRQVAANPPWGQVTALGVGPTFSISTGGTFVDYSPVALSDGPSVYVLATSQQGVLGTMPPQQLFLGKATLPASVGELAVARDQVFAIAGGSTYRYVWLTRPGEPPPDAGAGFPNAGTRLRVGNSAYPFVFDFTPDQNGYRVFDTFAPNANPVSATLADPISDMVDSDGRYVYAIANNKVLAAERSEGPSLWVFQTFGMNSPGRDQLLDCSGNGNQYLFRSIRVGDNPDLGQVEHPLIALQVDVIGDAGVSHNWMRIDPDATLNACGNGVQRHVVRGNCPVCGPSEDLVDMQWGVDDVTGTATLRSECRPIGAPDGGRAPPNITYDLQTDSTGFACFRTRRLGFEYAGPPPLRATTSATVAGLASGRSVRVRRDAFDDWVPLTLDSAPTVAQSINGKLVALGHRTMFRETPMVGLAIHQQTQRAGASPTWISGDLLLYDDGRVGPVSNLERNPQDPRLLATPSRNDLEGPVSGTTATGSNGRQYLVMVANDALLGADLTDAGVRGEPPRSIEVKAVPEPQVQILSVAVLAPPPPSDTAPLFSGYVLTQNRVFALAAVTEQRWTLSAVDVEDAAWLEVWADGDRGRLGYTDGRVASLPSGVQIAPAVPGDAGVSDFQAHCGRAYALEPGGLWRLDAVTGSPQGEWKRETALDGGGPWERMYGGPGGELWVFGRDGTAALVKGAPCTQ